MKDKVIVITGASAGIGKALAELVGKKGAVPVLAARRRPELDAVAKAAGDRSVVVVADVSKRVDVERLAATAIEKCGRIDVWVNNAGRGISRLPSQLTDDDVDEMMLVNFKSALYGMQAVLPHFQQRNDGQIVNVSSMLGRVPFTAARAAYTASKHALDGLTGSLRLELYQSHPGITVTTVHPGVVATDFGNNAKHGGLDSRSFPNAQSAEQVADVIAQAIESKQVDVYTQPFGKKVVVDYFGADDMADAERAMLRR